MITRFAPSPTGYLHLGHALAAWVAYDWAQRHGGKMLLRFEDIDVTRIREEYYGAIEEDLQWLGIKWSGTPLRQRNRSVIYQQALEKLRSLGVLYPCFCTRKEILQMASAPQQGDDQEALQYPGKCRDLPSELVQKCMVQQKTWAWRLHAKRAAELCGSMHWHDQRLGKVAMNPSLLGDVVIARKDIGVSYHLAVVIDDADQDVDMITRGDDLCSSTHVHVMLQKLLGLSQPQYWHHPLVCDVHGRRLAKRHDALSLRTMRENGTTAEQVRQQILSYGGMSLSSVINNA